MALKTATVTLEGGDMRFVGRSGSGHVVVLDDGKSDTGMRPSELVPLALAGCTAMDVISILRKKRQEVRSYEVEARATQQDGPPNAFTRIDVMHVIEGSGLDLEAVRRAIELSATKYCAVGATLSSGMTEVHHAYHVRDDKVSAEVSDEVIVIGPQEAVVEQPTLATVG